MGLIIRDTADHSREIQIEWPDVVLMEQTALQPHVIPVYNRKYVP